MKQPSSPPRFDLDELLRQLPTGIEEPDEVGWNQRLESSLLRISTAAAGTPDATANAIGESVLDTPLPPEPGEPVASDPYGLSDGHEINYDELHVPMQSGEHFPLSAGYGEHPGIANVSVLEPQREWRWVNWAAVGAGALAAAAALALYVQRQHSSPVDLQLALEAGSPSAAMADSALASRDGAHPHANPEAILNRAPAAADLPTAEAVAAATAVHPVGGASRVKSGHAPAVDEQSAAKGNTEPELVPAAGPSTLIDHPSSGAISAALAKRLPEAQRCVAPGEANLPVRVVFASSGNVEHVEVLAPAARADTRSCVERALKLLNVEPFARSQYAVNVTVSHATNATLNAKQ
jgi:hypothetical protein